MTEVPPAAPGAEATAAASPAGERDEQLAGYRFDEPRRSRRWRARAERGGRRARAAGRADVDAGAATAGDGSDSDPSGCERSVCACARTCAAAALVGVEVVRPVGEACGWIAAPGAAGLRVHQMGPPLSLREGDASISY